MGLDLLNIGEAGEDVSQGVQAGAETLGQHGEHAAEKLATSHEKAAETVETGVKKATMKAGEQVIDAATLHELLFVYIGSRIVSELGRCANALEAIAFQQRVKTITANIIGKYKKYEEQKVVRDLIVILDDDYLCPIVGDKRLENPPPQSAGANTLSLMSWEELKREAAQFGSRDRPVLLYFLTSRHERVLDELSLVDFEVKQGPKDAIKYLIECGSPENTNVRIVKLTRAKGVSWKPIRMKTGEAPFDPHQVGLAAGAVTATAQAASLSHYGYGLATLAYKCWLGAAAATTPVCVGPLLPVTCVLVVGGYAIGMAVQNYRLSSEDLLMRRQN